MNAGVGYARIEQWYLRRDSGESFVVTGCDDKARTIEIQTFDGDLDEIDEETWNGLPLEFAKPPENWTGPVDCVEVDDLGYSETEMTGADWCQPLQPFRAEQEAWEDTTEREESAIGIPDTLKGDLAADSAAARDLASADALSTGS